MFSWYSRLLESGSKKKINEEIGSVKVVLQFFEFFFVQHIEAKGPQGWREGFLVVEDPFELRERAPSG